MSLSENERAKRVNWTKNEWVYEMSEQLNSILWDDLEIFWGDSDGSIPYTTYDD